MPPVPASLSLIVLDTSTAAGTVNLACSATPTQQANVVEIATVQVANPTNIG